MVCCVTNATMYCLFDGLTNAIINGTCVAFTVCIYCLFWWLIIIKSVQNSWWVMEFTLDFFVEFTYGVQFTTIMVQNSWQLTEF